MRAEQLSLFHEKDDHAAVAALAGILPMVRAAMNSVAEEHPILSRDLIADQITELSRMAGVKLTQGNAKGVKPATIEKWLAPGDREHPPSIAALVAFCLITKSVKPLEPLLSAMGCEVMTEEDRRKRDYADAILAEREARKNKKKLEAEF
ncbi:MAG: hypothetical protein CL942_00155 [Desulfovibrio sp.]|nr:hypothetical protein [Desulfovibrio sp.]|tara:strand:+ start:2760 stop:3209 length:450 start_codon:yes stop_codon:yes gene_type:complete